MNFNIIAILSSLIYVTLGHMSMQFPKPRGGTSYAVWQHNEPMITVHPQICHGLGQDATVLDVNKFAAGDTITITIAGSASHNGGHCTFWVSTDDVTWYKIIDTVDCTLPAASSAREIIIPQNLPSACSTRCTFAFTWIPTSSGACEIYMNCADIQVTGVNGNWPSSVSKNFNTDIINAANFGCVRVDGGSHLSQTFTPFQLDYANVETPTDPENPIEIEEPIIDQGNCYSNPTMAKWLSNDISNMGRCGVPNPTAINRCDDGQCCSSAGYCGPEFDGTGYIQYDDFGVQIGYFSTNTEAYATYCDTNALGDWRVGACSTDNGSTSNANQKSIIVSFIFSLFFILFFIF